MFQFLNKTALHQFAIDSANELRIMFESDQVQSDTAE